MRTRAALIGGAIALAASVAATVLVLAFRDADDASARPTESPEDFVSRVVAQIVSDDYATAWETLYPPHQAVADSDEYVSCEMETPVGRKLRSIAVIRVVDKELRIPGDSRRSPAKAVTLRLRFASPSLGAKDAFTHTFNTVATDAHWRWILTPGRYELYRDDSCERGYTPSS